MSKLVKKSEESEKTEKTVKKSATKRASKKIDAKPSEVSTLPTIEELQKELFSTQIPPIVIEEQPKKVTTPPQANTGDLSLEEKFKHVYPTPSVKYAKMGVTGVVRRKFSSFSKMVVQLPQEFIDKISIIALREKLTPDELARVALEKYVGLEINSFCQLPKNTRVRV